MFQCSRPYSARPIRFAGAIEHRGWRLKRYDIHIEGDPIDPDVYEQGCAYALASLPDPAETDRRPGVGFVICHQGSTVDYLILNWWDNENELFQRVCIRSRPEGRWEPGEGRGSFCVWDAQVIWHEREAYVRSVLSDSPDLDAYLQETNIASTPARAAAHGS